MAVSLYPNNGMSFTENQHGLVVLDKLRQQRNLEILCDVVLRVGEKKFVAHRCVLAASSPFFAAHFKGKVIIDEQNVAELLKLANQYLVCKLKEHCAEYLQRYLDLNNCITVNRMASEFNLEMLQTITHNFIAKNIAKILEGDEIFTLSYSVLEDFLKSKNWNITGEEMLELLSRWVSLDPAKRGPSLPSLMLWIPWPYIQDDSVLHRLLEPSQCEEQDLALYFLYDALDKLNKLPSYCQKHFCKLKSKCSQRTDVFDNKSIINLAISTLIDEHQEEVKTGHAFDSYKHSLPSHSSIMKECCNSFLKGISSQNVENDMFFQQKKTFDYRTQSQFYNLKSSTNSQIAEASHNRSMSYQHFVSDSSPLQSLPGSSILFSSRSTGHLHRESYEPLIQDKQVTVDNRILVNENCDGKDESSLTKHRDYLSLPAMYYQNGYIIENEQIYQLSQENRNYNPGCQLDLELHQFHRTSPKQRASHTVESSYYTEKYLENTNDVSCNKDLNCGNQLYCNESSSDTQNSNCPHDMTVANRVNAADREFHCYEKCNFQDSADRDCSSCSFTDAQKNFCVTDVQENNNNVDEVDKFVSAPLETIENGYLQVEEEHIHGLNLKVLANKKKNFEEFQENTLKNDDSDSNRMLDLSVQEEDENIVIDIAKSNSRSSNKEPSFGKKKKKFSKNKKEKLRKKKFEMECEVCGVCFERKILYFRHMKTHFPGPPHACTKCDAVFQRIYHLLDHKRIHEDDKKFKCHYCSYKTYKQYNLTEHLNIHSKKKPYKCNTCQEVFSRQHYLKKHMLNKHSDAKPYACDSCGWTTKLKDELIRHVKIHTDYRNGEHDILSSQVEMFSELESTNISLQPQLPNSPQPMSLSEYPTSPSSNSQFHSFSLGTFSETIQDTFSEGPQCFSDYASFKSHSACGDSFIVDSHMESDDKKSFCSTSPQYPSSPSHFSSLSPCHTSSLSYVSDAVSQDKEAVCFSSILEG